MIKSDRWIIRMGQERQMIEPFEAKQVKVFRMEIRSSRMAYRPMGMTFR